MKKAIDLTASERLYAIRVSKDLAGAMDAHERAKRDLQAAQAGLEAASAALVGADAERREFELAVLEAHGNKPGDVPQGPASIESLDGKAMTTLRMVWCDDDDEDRSRHERHLDDDDDEGPEAEAGEPGGPMLGEAHALEVAKARVEAEAKAEWEEKVEKQLAEARVERKAEAERLEARQLADQAEDDKRMRKHVEGAQAQSPDALNSQLRTKGYEYACNELGYLPVGDPHPSCPLHGVDEVEPLRCESFPSDSIGLAKEAYRRDHPRECDATEPMLEPTGPAERLPSPGE